MSPNSPDARSARGGVQNDLMDPDGIADPSAPSDLALVPRAGFFEGQIAIVGKTRIDGTVLGSLQGPGHLVLGTEARVEGRIECTSLSSRGEIVGPVVAKRQAHFDEGARFEGDLVASAVQVDGDVVWNGKARVSRSAADERA